MHWCTEPYIENETLGFNAPAMPRRGVELTDKIASLSGEYDSLEWAKLLVAMYSLSYVEDDIRVIMDKAMNYIQENSWPYKVYLKVKELYAQNPDDWRAALPHILRMHRNVHKIDSIKASPDINNGILLLAMQFGQNDYDETMKIASLCNNDGDCTAASIGGIVGLVKGMAGTPEVVLTDLYNDGKGIFVNDLVSGFQTCIMNDYPEEQLLTDIVKQYQSNAEDQIILMGGKVDKDNYYIPVEPTGRRSSLYVENYDFESGTLEGFEKWSPSCDTSLIYPEMDKHTHSGDWKAVVNTSPEITEGKLYTTLNGLVDGATYRVTAYLTSPVGAQARLYADNFDTRTEDDYRYMGIGANLDRWASVTLDFRAWGGSAEIGLHVLNPEGKDNYWGAIDDIFVTEITPHTVYKSFEAEGDPNISTNAPVANSDSASGGQYVNMEKSGDYIEISGLEVNKTGEYNLEIFYSNTGKTLAGQKLYVNGVEQAIAYFPPSGDRTEFSRNRIDLPVDLKKGSNTVKLLNFEMETYMAIDYVNLSGFSNLYYDGDPRKTVFKDLGSTGWAVDQIMYLSEKGHISGKGDEVFAPNDYVSYREFIKMAVGAFSLLDENAQTTLTGSGDWSYKYIASALEKGILENLAIEELDFDAPIPRQDMAVIAYRGANLAQMRWQNSIGQDAFSDEGEVAQYAREAVRSMQLSGVLQGYGDNRFNPHGSTTRAEAANLVYQLLCLER